MSGTPPKPMLACKDWSFDDIVYPCYVQPKYDGVRALVKHGVVYGRSGEPIKNARVQRDFGWLHGFDGELVARGKMNDPKCCRLTTSIVNSLTKEESCDFIYYDYWDSTKNYVGRFDDALRFAWDNDHDQRPGRVIASRPVLTATRGHLEELDRRHLMDGFEGTIIRDPLGFYKEGRSTGKDRKLWALKGFTDTEAVIEGTVEMMHNGNEAEKTAFGRTKRSSKKEGKVASGVLGALVCRSPDWSETFEIGTGFSAEDRKALWRDRDKLVGRTVRFKFFDHGGKDRPRHPVFITFRSTEDM